MDELMNILFWYGAGVGTGWVLLKRPEWVSAAASAVKQKFREWF